MVFFFTNPYRTHGNYAHMLHDHKKVTDNNLMAVVSMIMSRFDRLEGKRVDLLMHLLANWLQPPFGMP